MSKWRAFRRLKGAEQRLLLQSALLLCLATAALRCLGFCRLQFVLARLSPDRGKLARGKPQACLAARMVQTAARHWPFRVGCLPSALTLWWLLRLHDIESLVRVGVRRTATGIEAHAWVEYAGEVLADGNEAHKR